MNPGTGSHTQTTIVAHRGYSAVAPENTIAALDRALAAGVDAVEFDVSTASCGTPVLFHDPNLGRTTNGVGPLRRRTLAQLRALDAGKWFSPEFEGERIPTLDEAFEAVSGRVGQIFAEIKGWREMEDIDRMVGVARRRELIDHTVFVAMDWTTLDRVVRAEPECRVAYVVERPDRFEEAIAKASQKSRGGLAIDHEILLADPSRIGLATSAGLDIGVWTVDDPEVASSLHDLGVRVFTTNRVQEMMSWKQQLQVTPPAGS